MTRIDELNTIISALRVLDSPNSGYPAPVAVGLAHVFQAYAELHSPEELRAPVLELADAILHPLVVTE